MSGEFSLTVQGLEPGSPCDLCGAACPSAGPHERYVYGPTRLPWHRWIERHRGNKACRMAARERQLRQDGFTEVGNPITSRVLREATMLTYAPRATERGHVYAVTWAPKWAVVLVEHMERTSVPMSGRAQIAKAASQEPAAFRDALVSGYDLDEAIAMLAGHQVKYRKRPSGPEKRRALHEKRTAEAMSKFRAVEANIQRRAAERFGVAPEVLDRERS